MIDEKIKPLVDFLNTITGVKTTLSCQGHNNDKNGNTNPYITFVCTNVKSLNIIAKVDGCGYTDIEDYGRDDIPQPQINGSWRVCIIGIDDNVDLDEIIEEDDLDIKPDELVLYRLYPDKDSYDKPSDLYDDFDGILKYLKYYYEKCLKEDEKIDEETLECMLEKIKKETVNKHHN